MSDFSNLDGLDDLHEHSTKRQRLDEKSHSPQASTASLLRNGGSDDGDKSHLPLIDFSWEDHVRNVGATMFKRRYRFVEDDFNELCNLIWDDLSALNTQRSRGIGYLVSSVASINFCHEEKK